VKFGTRTLVGVLAATFLAVGASSIAWAADQNTTPGAVISATPSPNPSSGIVIGVATDTQGNLFMSRQADGEIVVYAPGSQTPLRNIPVTSSPGLIDIGADGNLYVPTSSKVTVYDLAGTQLRQITGPATTLVNPLDAGTDAAGNIYVSDYSTNSVVVFAPGANGDVAPIRTISGGATNINDAYGINVLADGSFWLASNGWNSGSVSLAYWPAGASGNVAPSRAISGANTGFAHPVDSIINAAGELVISGYTPNNDGAVAFFPSTSNGDITPTNRILGSNTHLSRAMGLAEDSCGGLFVANFNQEVAIFGTPCGSNGSVSSGGSQSGGSSETTALAQTGSTVSPLWFVGGASVVLGLTLGFVAVRRRTR
jgi:LPXTG-motif cell wall-anchored protein